MSTPAAERWEQYKQQVLVALAKVKFAPVYGDIQDAKPSGNDCLAGRCPFHDDARPSFGFSTLTGQWSCFAGCGEGSAFDYLMRRSNRTFKDVLVSLGEALGLPPPAARGNEAGLITYDYRDESGALLFQVLRRPGKDFRQRRPNGKGGWSWRLGDVRRVLYRLPDLIARAEELVYITEGEKDVDRLHAAGLLATTNSGGAGKWKPSHSESLRGRNVIILPDNDAPGQAHALQVANALTGVAASIKIVVLPDVSERGDVSDWLADGHTVQELQDLVVGTPNWEPAGGEVSAASRPVIIISDRQLRDVISDSWRVLLAQNNPPRLFASAGQLARLVESDSGPGIQHLGEVAAHGVLLRSAEWKQWRQGALRAARPPKDVARDLLVNPCAELPLLDAVVGAPVFDADGRLLLEPGYHGSARLWLHRGAGTQVLEVPRRPTEDQVASAVALLCEELLVDFPFTAPSDLAHALAAIILPFVRRMIPGPTPIHLIEAPTPGSGKGLLADLISILALGRSSESTTISKDEDELRKKLTSIFSRGHPVVVFDNVKGGLESAQIAAAITAETWSDRLLGKNQMVEFPNRVVWVVTANNPELSLEIARRCIRIRLEPSEERPWERSEFKHDPLRVWTREHRSELIQAVLTICQSWIAAGRPPGTKTLGSFEHWASTLGGILQHAGVRDFLQDTNEFYAAADLESGEWRVLIEAWWQKYGGQPVGARELIALAEKNDVVAFAYAAKSEQAQRARFGRALSDLRGRRFGDLQVMVGENANRKIHTYRLVLVTKDPYGVKEPF